MCLAFAVVRVEQARRAAPPLPGRGGLQKLGAEAAASHPAAGIDAGAQHEAADDRA